MKKIIALALALIMALSMSVVAFAADPAINGTFAYDLVDSFDVAAARPGNTYALPVYSTFGLRTDDKTAADYVGKYKLSETTVPAGYNKANDVEFTITANHNADSDNPDLITLTSTFGEVKTAADGSISGNIEDDIENKTGTVLPETGAKGTMMLITVSTMIVMAAVVFMITRKKMSIYED